MQAVFDGHNDVLFRLWENARNGGDPVREFTEGTDRGHIDAPRARAGGLAGGLSAIFLPSPEPMTFARPDAEGRFENPLPSPLDPAASIATALAIAAIALKLDRAGAWRLCRTVADIRSAMDAGLFAAVLHMEGAEAIDPDLNALEVFYAAGLRSLGPVWSRNNVFGNGVPFAYPKLPSETGPGLTEAGFRLVATCNELGIVIDLSHITEQGFWDVAKTSQMPLVASHSNAHVLTPSARNLTDRQLDAIRDSQGLVGLNFATGFLRRDGRENADTPLTDMVRHVDHMVERMGVDCVAIGSDFDGCTVPAEIGDASGTQKLIAALRQCGYGEEDLAKIARENWLRILGRTFRERP